MNKNEFTVNLLKAMFETFPAINAMCEYDENVFEAVICAMIDTYAVVHESDKIDILIHICEAFKEQEDG